MPFVRDTGDRACVTIDLIRIDDDDFDLVGHDFALLASRFQLSPSGTNRMPVMGRQRGNRHRRLLVAEQFDFSDKSKVTRQPNSPVGMSANPLL
jgi:hypothetical protein